MPVSLYLIPIAATSCATNSLIGPDDIGIISPYSAQNKKLRELDIVKKHRKELKTGTVEAFQAQVSKSFLASARY